MVVELKPRIVVVGVGGAGGNAVNNMIEADLQGVDFIVANTDSQALLNSRADIKIQLGADMTKGLGAGAKPDVGASAAEESIDDIRRNLEGSNMVFVAAGMGGGTGTGAAPVIARVAKEMNILTVGVITKPFDFEGRRRMTIADGGVKELRESVDTLIIIPNQNLFRIASANTTLSDAFSLADEVLHAGVRGITDLMVMPGLINLDFADVQTVMSEMGAAMMGTGEADGEGRASKAAQSAISNPLLDDISVKGAKGILINITGGDDMTLYEVDEAANLVREEVDPDAQIILGSAFNANMAGKIRVSVVATGIQSGAFAGNSAETVKPVAEAAPAAEAPAPVVNEPPPVEPTPAPVMEAVEDTAPETPAEPVVETMQAVSEADAFNAPEAPVVEDVSSDVHRPVITTRQSFMEAEEADEPSAHDAHVETPEAPADDLGGTEAQQDKGGFSGLFGWRRGAGGSEAQEAAAASGDDYAEDDLEIPAFLRRSASS